VQENDGKLRIFLQEHISSLMMIRSFAAEEQTEKKLLENLRSMTDKTVVIVTHRPAALDICDRVLCFTENGVSEQ